MDTGSSTPTWRSGFTMNPCIVRFEVAAGGQIFQPLRRPLTLSEISTNVLIFVMPACSSELTGMALT